MVAPDQLVALAPAPPASSFIDLGPLALRNSKRRLRAWPSLDHILTSRRPGPAWLRLAHASPGRPDLFEYGNRPMPAHWTDVAARHRLAPDRGGRPEAGTERSGTVPGQGPRQAGHAGTACCCIGLPATAVVPAPASRDRDAALAGRLDLTRPHGDTTVSRSPACRVLQTAAASSSGSPWRGCSSLGSRWKQRPLSTPTTLVMPTLGDRPAARIDMARMVARSSGGISDQAPTARHAPPPDSVNIASSTPPMIGRKLK